MYRDIYNASDPLSFMRSITQVYFGAAESVQKVLWTSWQEMRETTEVPKGTMKEFEQRWENSRRERGPYKRVKKRDNSTKKENNLTFAASP